MQSKQYKWKLFGAGAALRKDKLGSDIEYLSAVQIGYGSHKKHHLLKTLTFLAK